MKQGKSRQNSTQDAVGSIPAIGEMVDYWTDAWQRTSIFLDVMRKRDDQAREHAANPVPNVLNFEAELVSDGRTFDRPVNYLLVRIIPQEGVEIDPAKRPFVVIDPRAGHGPGIGGFKADSEIGVAMKAGHPCYFVGFLPQPIPGQTIMDIALAEAIFLEAVIARHSEVDEKPCVIGNCQAGWAVMILASLRPELFGPIIIAGSPLSYWAGVHGANPMRYSGGLLGGSWLTAMTGDLGNGKFDGTHLVKNFEDQNPANTLWSKNYNLYSNVDTEEQRYLGFERWWGGHVSLNAEEMQFIVDELFVGNKLAAGGIHTDDGVPVDMRNITTPIVVFCSKGDNITPPQQALGWILDLYDDVDEIRAYGQTIVYTVHETVGHLGIFVSAGVARKEHGEFASNIDLIDVLPSGLYEAVLEPKDDAVNNPDLVNGEWVTRFEPRVLDDIRAMGGNSLEDDRCFEAAAKVSEINLSLYRAFAQPVVRAMTTTAMAEASRHLPPLKLKDGLFSPASPVSSWLSDSAKHARENRKPVAEDNPFLKMQEQVSQMIVSNLDSWQKAKEKMAEKTFYAIYGSPELQAVLGVDQNPSCSPSKAAKNPSHQAQVAARIVALKEAMTEGGLAEGLARALLYVAMARAGIDERGFEAIRRMRKLRVGSPKMTIAEFKKLIREQNNMLVIDEEAAVAAIPGLIPVAPKERQAAFEVLLDILKSPGEVTGVAATRLSHIADILDVAWQSSGQPTVKERAAPKKRQARRTSPAAKHGAGGDK
ncbi:MAG: hypothetical protein DRQ61_04345 [Gammaproteobacteria bacterium]|nr:MAG: hypothetical protein DRQ61_04345 [Gammaproteobacteria bacterium]